MCGNILKTTGTNLLFKNAESTLNNLYPRGRTLRKKSDTPLFHPVAVLSYRKGPKGSSAEKSQLPREGSISETRDRHSLVLLTG